MTPPSAPPRRVQTPPRIVVVEDDEDDCLLLQQALAHARPSAEARFVRDAEALFDYLYRKGRYADAATSPAPDLVLLDLNLGRTDGRDALTLMKGDSTLRHIPVIVLTTSRADRDVRQCYALGANAFVTKPVAFDDYVELVGALIRHWFDLCELPGRGAGSHSS